MAAWSWQRSAGPSARLDALEQQADAAHRSIEQLRTHLTELRACAAAVVSGALQLRTNLKSTTCGPG